MNLKNIFLFITLFYSVSFPQFKEIGADFKRFIKTGEDVFISPAKWGKTEWFIFSGTVTVTSVTFLADKHARIFSKTSFGDRLFSIDKVFNVAIPTIAIAGIYDVGLY